MTVVITLANVEDLAYYLASEFLQFDEPIPDFSTRYPHRLESCLLTPFQGISGREFYPTLSRKAAILFYLMVKNHPFQNGNKRIAVTTLLTFLYLNNKWLKVPTQVFLDLTVLVALSSPSLKDDIVNMIDKFIRDHLTAFPSAS